MFVLAVFQAVVSLHEVAGNYIGFNSNVATLTVATAVNAKYSCYLLCRVAGKYHYRYYILGKTSIRSMSIEISPL